MAKCNVCQAVNEQFHGNIVTLLLTAIGAEFLSFGVSSSSEQLLCSLEHSLANACLIDLLMFTCACLATGNWQLAEAWDLQTYNMAHNLL